MKKEEGKFEKEERGRHPWFAHRVVLVVEVELSSFTDGEEGVDNNNLVKSESRDIKNAVSKGP